MDNCPDCSSHLPEGAVFCPGCGRPLGTTQHESSAPVPSSALIAAGTTGGAASRKRHRAMWIAIAACAVVVAAAVVLTVLFLPGGNRAYTAVVKVQGARVLSEPSMDGTVVAEVPEGQRVGMLKEVSIAGGKKWAQVQVTVREDGQQKTVGGYMERDKVEPVVNRNGPDGKVAIYDGENIKLLTIQDGLISKTQVAGSIPDVDYIALSADAKKLAFTTYDAYEGEFARIGAIDLTKAGHPIRYFSAFEADRAGTAQTYQLVYDPIDDSLIVGLGGGGPGFSNSRIMKDGSWAGAPGGDIYSIDAVTGHLIVSWHQYYEGGGSYEESYVVNRNGDTIRDFGTIYGSRNDNVDHVPDYYSPDGRLIVGLGQLDQNFNGGCFVLLDSNYRLIKELGNQKLQDGFGYYMYGWSADNKKILLSKRTQERVTKSPEGYLTYNEEVYYAGLDSFDKKNRIYGLILPDVHSNWVPAGLANAGQAKQSK